MEGKTFEFRTKFAVPFPFCGKTFIELSERPRACIVLIASKLGGKLVIPAFRRPRKKKRPGRKVPPGLCLTLMA
jgi:hypothetical protein